MSCRPICSTKYAKAFVFMLTDLVQASDGTIVHFEVNKSKSQLKLFHNSLVLIIIFTNYQKGRK